MTRPQKTLRQLWEHVVETRWQGTKKEVHSSKAAYDFIDWCGEGKSCYLVLNSDPTKFRSKLKGKAATVNRNMRPVVTMLKTGIDLGWVESDVLAGFRELREEENERCILTELDRFNMRQHLKKQRHRDLFDFLFQTGMRVGEALNLRQIDYHPDRRCVVLPGDRVKNDKGRAVSLTSRAQEILEQANPHLDPFVDINYQSFHHDWDQARKAIGKEHVFGFTPHALRHTCATELLRRGVPVEAVKKWLGHKSLATTMRYLHATQEDLDAARDTLEAS